MWVSYPKYPGESWDRHYSGRCCKVFVVPMAKQVSGPHGRGSNVCPERKKKAFFLWAATPVCVDARKVFHWREEPRRVFVCRKVAVT